MIRLNMSESDIIRSIKNTQYSPIQHLAAKYFKEKLEDIDVTKDSIIIWNDEINDYKSYRYCNDDIELVSVFLDEWQDFIDEYIPQFNLNPISFCVEENK